MTTVEMEFAPPSGDDLALDAEDLAPYDEIEGDEAAPGFGTERTSRPWSRCRPRCRDRPGRDPRSRTQAVAR